MGSRSSPGSKRNVVLYPLFHAPDFPNQVGQISAVFDEVDLRAVDHEQRGLRIVMKEGPERFRQALQVLRGDAAFEVTISLADPAHQDVGPRLEVDDQIGPGNLRVEELEYLAVEGELVVAEGDAGEDAVLGEEIVRDRSARSHAPRAAPELVPGALEGEEKLGLQRMSLGIAVEFRQGRLLFGSLHADVG